MFEGITNFKKKIHETSVNFGKYGQKFKNKTILVITLSVITTVNIWVYSQKPSLLMIDPKYSSEI